MTTTAATTTVNITNGKAGVEAAAVEGEVGGEVEGEGASPREWGGYEDVIFDDLVVRFERPDSKNRWDSPLFTLRPPIAMPASSGLSGEHGGGEGGGGSGSGGDSTSGGGAYNDASREETLQIAVAMITGRHNNESGASGSRALTPNAATKPSMLLSDTNLRTAGLLNPKS